MAIRRIMDSYSSTTATTTLEEDDPIEENSLKVEEKKTIPKGPIEIIERFGGAGGKRNNEVVARLENMFSSGGEDYNRVLMFYRRLFVNYEDLGLEMPDILEGDSKRKIVYESGYDMVPRIKPKDFGLFNIYLAQLSRSMSDHQDLPYASEHLMYDIWLNATYEDFESPELFVRRMSEQIEDDTFSELDSNQFVALETMGNRALHFQRTKNNSAYEAPFNLSFGLTEEGIEEPLEENLLPSVRYGVERITGFSPEKRAYIYAMQDPPVDGITEGLMKSSRQTEQLRAQRYFHEYKLWAFGYPRQMEQIVGTDNYKLLTEPGDQDLEEIVSQISDRISRGITDGTLDYGAIFGIGRGAEQSVDDNTYKKILETIAKSQECMQTLSDYKHIGEVFEKRRANNKILKEAFSEGIPNSKKEIRSVPPSRIVSMCAALTMMHSSGIKEVKIPIFLPLRYQHKRIQMQRKSIKNSELEVAKRPYENKQADAEKAKDGADELYGNISRSLMNLAERMAYEIDGVEVVGLPDDMSFITLRLGRVDQETGEEIPLSSNRPLLQEIITKTAEMAKVK